MDILEQYRDRVKSRNLTIGELRFLFYSGKVSRRNLTVYYLSEFEGVKNKHLANKFGVSKTRIGQMKNNVKLKASIYLKKSSETKPACAHNSLRRDGASSQSSELFDIRCSNELHAIARHLSEMVK